MKKEHTPKERFGTAQRKQQLLDQITAYVDRNLDQRITLQSVAEHFQISVSTVTQLFQRKAQTTFHQFLTEKRMKAAETLIARGIPLEEVGKQVGFNDHSSFYRAFKKHFGVSPRSFRREQAEE